ncbi:hypothetical protein Hanom_Chr15g01349161 [Helianthus anomalus]
MNPHSVRNLINYSTQGNSKTTAGSNSILKLKKPKYLVSSKFIKLDQLFNSRKQ